MALAIHMDKLESQFLNVRHQCAEVEQRDPVLPKDNADIEFHEEIRYCNAAFSEETKMELGYERVWKDKKERLRAVTLMH